MLQFVKSQQLQNPQIQCPMFILTGLISVKQKIILQNEQTQSIQFY